MAHLREREFVLLEIGVWGGQSLEMWRDCLPGATVVGVDVIDSPVKTGERLHFAKGDQSDCGFLAGLRRRFAPEDGFSVIIDDASHVAGPTAASLCCLFNDHLASGGLYIIEDWGTGYLDGWGGRPMKAKAVDLRDLGVDARGFRGKNRLSSHDYGMVGLVKRLIDQMTVSAWKRDWRAGTSGLDPRDEEVVDEMAKGGRITELIEANVLDIAKLTAYPGLVVLEKA